MLARSPGLTPDQVKAILVGTTQPYGPPVARRCPIPPLMGSGLLNAQAAVFERATRVGQYGLDAVQCLCAHGVPALFGKPLVWRNPNYKGIAWNTLTWATLSWTTSPGTTSRGTTSPGTTSRGTTRVGQHRLGQHRVGPHRLDNIAWDNIAWTKPLAPRKISDDPGI